jgi:hypothetical protein
MKRRTRSSSSKRQTKMTRIMIIYEAWRISQKMMITKLRIVLLYPVVKELRKILH